MGLLRLPKMIQTIYGVEPLGKILRTSRSSASLLMGEEGIMHGFNSIMLKDERESLVPVYSVASGLDYCLRSGTCLT